MQCNVKYVFIFNVLFLTFLVCVVLKHTLSAVMTTEGKIIFEKRNYLFFFAKK